jgi:hypothetical protein
VVTAVIVVVQLGLAQQPIIEFHFTWARLESGSVWRRQGRPVPGHAPQCEMFRFSNYVQFGVLGCEVLEKLLASLLGPIRRVFGFTKYQYTLAATVSSKRILI